MKTPTTSVLTRPASSPVDPGAAPFDVDDFTLQARAKLSTLSFLLSELDVQLAADNDVFHGLSWILDDIRQSLTRDTTAAGAK